MLVHPGWRSEGLALECRRAQWVPHPRLASYVAPPHPLTIYPQIEDEYSSSSCASSPEHGGGVGGEEWSDSVVAAGVEHDCTCEWVGCNMRVRGVTALSAHVASQHAHPHADGLFYCGWRSCTRPHRGFNARYKMLVHVRTHTNEKPHACLQCHKCFSRAENLKIHMRSHSGEKPYVCPFQGCNKAYSNSSDRFKHTRTHAVDKPYCCKVPGCDKRYTDPSSLRKHVKTYRHFTSTAACTPSPQPMTPFSHTPAPVSPAEERLRRTDSISPSEWPSRRIDEPVRVPTYDMSYVEYSRLYGYPSSPLESPHYRNYNVILRSKDYVYEATPYSDVTMRDVTPPRQYEPLQLVEEPEEPLDLKCRRSEYTEELQVKPADDSMQFQLLRAMEMPLDLSTKS